MNIRIYGMINFMRIINLDDGGGREGCKKNGEIEIG
jgi:hypothetical protein